MDMSVQWIPLFLNHLIMKHSPIESMEDTAYNFINWASWSLALVSLPTPPPQGGCFESSSCSINVCLFNSWLSPYVHNMWYSKWHRIFWNVLTFQDLEDSDTTELITFLGNGGSGDKCWCAHQLAPTKKRMYTGATGWLVAKSRAQECVMG